MQYNTNSPEKNQNLISLRCREGVEPKILRRRARMSVHVGRPIKKQDLERENKTQSDNHHT